VCLEVRVLLWEGEYFYLAICRVMKLYNFCLLTEVITVRFESVFCARVYRHHYMIGLCDSYCHLVTQSGINWLCCTCYLLAQFRVKKGGGVRKKEKYLTAILTLITGID
jgi:hypothetical protein